MNELAEVIMPKLKVKRTEAAKDFQMLHVAKDGDVGLDIPACLPPLDIPQDEYEVLCHAYADGEINEAQFMRITHESITIQPHERGVIPTGISLEIPHGYWVSIEARSSTSASMLIAPKGVIDEGYRGELFSVLINVGKEPVTIYHGDRYVQLILNKREIGDVQIEEVDELSPSERGTSGFGSTGRTAG